MADLFEKDPDYSKLGYDELVAFASTCKKCPLSKGRTKVVFGTGPVPCDLMLIGEAPGADEDIKGEPFVGRAGQLLTEILKSVDIKRPGDIYIANTVKCRPPENRAPLATEQEACWPYLEAQIHDFVKPKIIILAGAPAIKAVLKTEEPISKIRGKWLKYKDTDISVMPIFHPAYLLRNQRKDPGSPKWLTWQDMKEVKGALDFLRKAKALTQEQD